VDHQTSEKLKEVAGKSGSKKKKVFYGKKLKIKNIREKASRVLLNPYHAI